jgi:hypothetical protein
MRIYIAARFSRRDEMQEVAALLRARGHTITSRWIDGHEDEGGEYLLGGTNRELYATFAREDLEDVQQAETVVSFTEPPRAGNLRGRGGRHVEYGYALALEKRLIVVGPLENVFHCLDCVTVCRDVAELLTEVSP